MNKHEVFNLTIEVPATPEDMFIELGFSPKEILIENPTKRTAVRWTTDCETPTIIAAAGTRTAGAATALTVVTTSTTVLYDDPSVPSYVDSNGDSVDKDLYIDGASGNKSLAYYMPQLSSSTDNHNSYKTKPGISIDVSALTDVVVASDHIVISAKR